ncbi:MAG: hypothetical protein AB1589_09335 [Cyanobacteriota bacterium]
MINNLKGFFSSSQHWPLKGWELPLTGLLLTAGLAATVSALKTTAPPKPIKTVESPAGVSSLQAIEPLQQEQAIESPSSVAPSPVEQAAVPLPLQEQATDIPTVKSSWEALIPQSPQEQAVVSPTTVEPSVQAAVPQPLQEQAVASPTIEPSVQTAPPQRLSKVVPSPTVAKAVPSPTVAPSVNKAVVPQPPAPVLDAPVAAKLPANWKNSQEVSKANIPPVPRANDSLADGTYLYGQSSEPEQIGKEYLVFEARQGKVVGAMYMPNSEFACFHGTLNSKQMSLTVANAYNQTALAHTIAREQPTRIAAAGGQIDLDKTYDSLTYPYSVVLDSYQPIAQVSAKDKQMLSTCLSNYQETVWNH